MNAAPHFRRRVVRPLAVGTVSVWLVGYAEPLIVALVTLAVPLVWRLAADLADRAGAVTGVAVVRLIAVAAHLHAALGFLDTVVLLGLRYDLKLG